MSNPSEEQRKWEELITADTDTPMTFEEMARLRGQECGCHHEINSLKDALAKERRRVSTLEQQVFLLKQAILKRLPEPDPEPDYCPD